ncbi:hypothetical protein QNI19_14640 [Cytophagaceae bacterium DM2B3-1]|uniref:Uncharacterized protein n=1 Tax=Xanthocytophaga flava TaxID=3048013 RepID=A0ABT7CK96_9BACT|nr:hypothetical protein [Xanthocytophaga flavus]MDJ1494178.1 hypothetical protein [Xanthocytophaga flavus]
MKPIKLKLNKQEARLFADVLSTLIQVVPNRQDYEEGSSGDWYYAVDVCMAGIVALIWHKYYTKLLACEEGGTFTVSLLKPHAIALQIHMSYLQGKWKSKDHEHLVQQVSNHIHKSTT